MALKGDRKILETNIRNYCNQVVEKGKVLSLSAAGSGVALDSTVNVVVSSASSSGQKPVGLLLTDIVSLDLTRFPVNWHRDQANSGDKVCLMTKGWAVTDQIVGTIVAGDWAVLSSSGTVGSRTRGAPFNEVADPRVGHWDTNKDQAGFATLYVDL